LEIDAVLRPHTKTGLPEAREQNRRLLLQLLFTQRTASRVELSRLSGLSKATVSEITTLLIDEGLVREAGLGISTGGKPPTLLTVDRIGRVVIALDLSGKFFQCGLHGLDGKLLERFEGSAVWPKGTEAGSEVTRLINDALGKVAAPPLGIGVAVPGRISTDGVVVSSALAWDDYELKTLLEHLYELPTVVSRTVDAAAVAEFARRPEWSNNTLIYALGQQEVSVGLIIDGRLKRAAGGLIPSEVSGSELDSQLASLLSVLPDGQIVVAGTLVDTPEFFDDLSARLASEPSKADRVHRPIAGVSAALRGAGALVVADEIGVAWQ
jgi:hypothetical protein